MAEREIDFFGSWNLGPAARIHVEPDWRGIHPDFSGMHFAMTQCRDHYVCPAGKLLVFSKANNLPHGGVDQFYGDSCRLWSVRISRALLSTTVTVASPAHLRQPNLLTGTKQPRVWRTSPDSPASECGTIFSHLPGSDVPRHATGLHKFAANGNKSGPCPFNSRVSVSGLIVDNRAP